MSPKTKRNVKKREVRTQKSITIRITEKLEDASSDAQSAEDRMVRGKQGAGIDFNAYASAGSDEVADACTDQAEDGCRGSKKGADDERTQDKSLEDARPFPGAPSPAGMSPGKVKSLAVKLARLIRMDGIVERELTKGPATADGGAGKVEEEALTKPSTVERGYLKKLENICKRMVSEKNTGSGEYMYIYRSSFELKNSCQYVCHSDGFKVRDIVAGSFEGGQGKTADAARKIVIPERSIKFQDALRMFEK